MNEVVLNGDKRMTVKEVATALNVSERVVQKHAADMGLTYNGKTTYLDEGSVTAIKNKIAASGRNDLANVREVGLATTDLEMKQKAAEVMAWLITESQRKDARILELEPKAAFFDQVADSKTAIPMRDVAAVLNIKGMGRNKIFEQLRATGVLDDKNVPYRRFQDAGYFRVVERSWSDKDGESHVTLTTLVYQKGVEFIRRQVTA